MGEQADIIKRFGGTSRNVDSLPCVATSHTWGDLLKVLVCEVANFLAGAGWVFRGHGAHARSAAVAQRLRSAL
jgi:hypothetical protein